VNKIEPLDEKCIEVLSEYLISLIKQKRFCDARRIGNAIEDVLNTQGKRDRETPMGDQPCTSTERR